MDGVILPIDVTGPICDGHDHDHDHDHGDGGHDHGDHDSPGHYMFFHLTVNTIIMFEKWATSSWADLLISCLAIVVMGIMYEGIKVFREKLYSRANAQAGDEKSEVPTQGFCNLLHFAQAFLHMVQVFVSYMLMLIFMTFNGYLCIAVLLGAGTGYLLTRWTSPAASKGAGGVDMDEHCC